MTAFATAISREPTMAAALDEALALARAGLGAAQPRLAVVFASFGLLGLEGIADALKARLPEVPFLGGTSAGAVFDSTDFAPRGLSVTLVGGDDLRASSRVVRGARGDGLEIAKEARELRKLADDHVFAGRGELACLAFAPSRGIVGDALVAALKKGATANAQLAGGLVSTTRESSGGLVWSDAGGVADSDVVMTGLFSERALGISVRHGWTQVGARHRVTRAEGARLHSLDGRPALEVWVEEAKIHGGELPGDQRALALYLASRYELAILDGPTPWADGLEPIVRGSRVVNDDGSVDLFGAVPEGVDVCLVSATEGEMFAAAELAATRALAKVGGKASGALGLMCAGRAGVLGERYSNEPRLVQRALGRPFGGTGSVRNFV
jgi:hypothetical protein